MEEQRGQDVRVADVARAAGVSRQAVYLHFPSRAELLVATVRYVDAQNHVDERVKPLFSAGSGLELLSRYVEFWGNYVPEIYGLAMALLAVRETDEAAAAAWNDRMEVVRECARCAIDCLEREGTIAPEWRGRKQEAVDMLWSMLSVRLWEHLVMECGWSTEDYIDWMKITTRRAFTTVK